MSNLFTNQSIDEKTQPEERFKQALDEHDQGLDTDVRNLLEENFASSWQKELGSIEKIEVAIRDASSASSIPDAINKFISHFQEPESWVGYANRLHSQEIISLSEFQETRYSCRRSFARDVANSFFTNSPFGFYQCFNTQNINFRAFTTISFYSPYYGEFNEIVQKLCSDPLLIEKGSEKGFEFIKVLYENLLYANLYENIDSRIKKAHFLNQLVTFYLREHDGKELSVIDSFQLDGFLKSFDFLTIVISHDSQISNHYKWLELLDELQKFLRNEVSSVFLSKQEKIPEDLKNGFKQWAHKWLNDKLFNLYKTWCCSSDVEKLTEDEFEVWSKTAHKAYLPISHELNDKQRKRLIAWGVQKDIDVLLANESNIYRFTYSQCWYISPHYREWRRQFVASINSLSIEDKMILAKQKNFTTIPRAVVFFRAQANIDGTYFWPDYVVSDSEKIPQGLEAPIAEKDYRGWRFFVWHIRKDSQFSNDFYPQWVVAMINTSYYDKRLQPYGDKSLGIIRGKLSSNSDIEITTDHLSQILHLVDMYAPNKAFKHRLLLLRNYQKPVATHTLDIDKDSLLPWSMRDIIDAFNNSSRQTHSSEEHYDYDPDAPLRNLRTEFAEFCLTRLRLRKGEKTANTDAFYTDKQVVESSDVWRKAYLKALLELGVDLGGKVHKAIHYVSQHDPQDEVRAVAKEAYKAVRREHNKTEQFVDMRKSLVAAYWWLLLAQRQALNEDINEEEAILTRRRLLRHS
jgi:hypothetical protein